MLPRVYRDWVVDTIAANATSRLQKIVRESKRLGYEKSEIVRTGVIEDETKWTRAS